LISWFAKTYLEDRHREVVITKFFGDFEDKELLLRIVNSGDAEAFKAFAHNTQSCC